MKKIFLFAALPALVLTGCSSDEILDTQKTAIEFNNVFVNKSSRAADLTADNFGNCKIWGSSSTANAYIFNGTDLNVTNSSTVTYNPIQYWTANTSYYFMAIGSTTTESENIAWSFEAPTAIPTAEGAFGTLSFDNVAAKGSVDIGYANASRIQPETINDAAVSLNFKHALSRTRFMFTNAMGVNYKIRVSNVVVSGTPAKGTLDFSNTDLTWSTEESTTVNYPFTGNKANAFANGASSDTDRQFLLPSGTDFTVSFDVDLFITVDGSDVHVNGDTPYHHTVAITQDLAMGTAYLFKTTIGSENIDPDGSLKPITFTVEVAPWDTPIDVPANIPNL